jgi:hypothetical protein
MTKAELTAAADALEWAAANTQAHMDGMGYEFLLSRAVEYRLLATEPEPVAWRALIGKPTPEGYDQWRYSSFTPHESRQEWAPLYAVPPDQSARIAELKDLLRRCATYTHSIGDADPCKHKALLHEEIHAALKETE